MACKNGSAALDPILFLNSAFCAKREHDRVKIGCHSGGHESAGLSAA